MRLIAPKSGAGYSSQVILRPQAELSVELDHLTPQKSEVEALKLVTFEAFEKLLNQNELNNHFIKSNSQYYLFVLNAIKQKLTRH